MQHVLELRRNTQISGWDTWRENSSWGN